MGRHQFWIIYEKYSIICPKTKITFSRKQLNYIEQYLSRKIGLLFWPFQSFLWRCLSLLGIALLVSGNFSRRKTLVRLFGLFLICRYHKNQVGVNIISETKKTSIVLILFWYVQAALVIRGFAIRGFDYSRFIICSQNSLFAVFPWLFAVF